MLALLLAVLADVNPEQVCAKYRTEMPAAAVAAFENCGGGHEGCDLQLAEDFANGRGVARDYDIAAYFLCGAESGIAVAEFEGMWQHLERMRDGKTTEDLEFCDYATSGYGGSYCANVRYEERMPALEARIDAARQASKAGVQFDALREAGSAYVRAESERIGEWSRGGTGYAAISLGAEIEEKERFVDAIERWSGERAPAADEDDLRLADTDLNDAYRAAREEIDQENEYQAEFRIFLRDAQRAWIAYRDAFAAWYVERWHGAAAPPVLQREIVTQLTKERAAHLRQ